MQLGSELCIAKLKDEVNEVQNHIEQLILTKGPFSIWSWKFSTGNEEVKKILEALNKRSFYVKNENQRRLTHLVLLEILIDR